MELSQFLCSDLDSCFWRICTHLHSRRPEAMLCNRWIFSCPWGMSLSAFIWREGDGRSHVLDTAPSHSLKTMSNPISWPIVSVMMPNGGCKHMYQVMDPNVIFIDALAGCPLTMPSCLLYMELDMHASFHCLVRCVGWSDDLVNPIPLPRGFLCLWTK